MEREKRSVGDDDDDAVPTSKRAASTAVVKTYPAMPPILRELHADKQTYLSLLSLDIASCALGPMIGHWVGATEAHVIGRYRIPCMHGAHYADSIGFDDTGRVVFAMAPFQECVHQCGDKGVDTTCYSPEIGRSIVTVHGPIIRSRGPGTPVVGHGRDRRDIVQSPHWTIVSSGLRIEFPPGALALRFIPLDWDSPGILRTATDGRGTYAVAMSAYATPNDCTGTIVHTTATAFAVDPGAHTDVRALAFDPHSGDLLLLTHDDWLNSDWHLLIVRPGPASQ
jgi:hypothetical protein